MPRLVITAGTEGTAQSVGAAATVGLAARSLRPGGGDDPGSPE
jgi:hypothetical protein